MFGHGMRTGVNISIAITTCRMLAIVTPMSWQAIATQAAKLNTHTRYLHSGIVDYCERLTAKFQTQLDQVIMVCSGSEANDIALRMAQAMTGKTGLIATDNTYHGNTMAVSQLSSRKPPIGGYASHIRHIPAPDSLRPVGGTADGQAAAFAQELQTAIDDLEASGHGFSGFVFCPTFANEGLPDLPRTFYEASRASGQSRWRDFDCR